MNIFDLDKNEFPTSEYFIALGDFDGLHIAHGQIIKNLISQANDSKCESAILLFKSPTRKSFGESNNILTSLEQKLEILEVFGMENVFLVSFDTVKNISPQGFLDMLSNIGVKGIFVGFDYSYGKAAKGDVSSLRQYANENNIYLNVMDPITCGDEVVSSSQIRNLIENCEFKKAEKLLGRTYSLRGRVVTGKKLGSKLGFPTANISLDVDYKLPEQGVYYAQIKYKDKIYASASSLGKNVTFDENINKIEAHILDFNENIYGENIQIRFMKYLRPMMKFDSLEDLIYQVNKDIELVARLSR